MFFFHFPLNGDTPRLTASSRLSARLASAGAGWRRLHLGREAGARLRGLRGSEEKRREVMAPFGQPQGT